MNAADAPVVAFFHPDLGIGGAERLVVDAAVGLTGRGYQVVVFTNHCDRQHCFDEARDGTLDVRVRAGSLLPRSLLGRFTILCAVARQLQLVFQLYFSGELAALSPNYFFVDQLSAGLPLLQYLFPRIPILFYCHFPDLLLAHGLPEYPAIQSCTLPDTPQSAPLVRSAALPTSRLGTIGRAYRAPFDILEGWSMGFATSVAVNSEFTRRVVHSTWPWLTARASLRVIYPCVDLASIDADASSPVLHDTKLAAMWAGEKVILSINRFERKKDIGLAVRAFAAIPSAKRKAVRLVIAGGYDSRVEENILYHQELERLAASLSLPSRTYKTLPSALAAPPADLAPVLFLHSVPTAAKLLLLRRASLLVYTPANEHFGIVPLEAMALHLPVLAAASGGPTETVVDGCTGWLRDSRRPDDWAEVMARVVGGDIAPSQLAEMGQKGTERVTREFGRDAMTQRIVDVLKEMDRSDRNPPVLNAVLNFIGIALMFALGLFVAEIYNSVYGRRR